MSTVARAAMPPNTPRAIDSGLMARSATSVLDSTPNGTEPPGWVRVISLSTAAMSLTP